MLAEVFMLRLETILRTFGTQTGASSDSRFVPVKLPVGAKSDESGSAVLVPRAGSDNARL
jgi:hypothetical protein